LVRAPSGHIFEQMEPQKAGTCENTVLPTIPGAQEAWRWSWRAEPPEHCRGAVVTVGNFDGVHRGHAALVRAARELAQRLQTFVLALTFDPHPLALLRPADFQPLLTTLEDRVLLLRACGAERVLVLQTDPELLRLPARAFFDQVLLRRLAARGMVEGPTFGFGYRREGNVELLQRWCLETGIAFSVVPALTVEGELVSSSRIRRLLQSGLVEQARSLLGRPYRLRGKVVAGQRRGHTLGAPTANLQGIATLIPGDGVYAAAAYYRSDRLPAAVHIGPNPTFEETARKVEVHVLDFCGRLYDEELAVDFLARLRDVRVFDCPEDLQKQIEADIASSRRIYEAFVSG